MFLGLYALNMGYLFDGTCRPLGRYLFISAFSVAKKLPGLKTASRRNRFAGTWLGKVSVPLPADFVQGMDTQRYDSNAGCRRIFVASGRIMVGGIIICTL